MKPVEVRVTLPEISLRINGKEILKKRDFPIEVKSAKELQHEVYLVIRTDLNPESILGLIANHVQVTLPKVELSAGSAATEVTSLQSSVNPFALARSTYGRSSIEKGLKHILANNPVTFTLEDGRVLRCKLLLTNDDNTWRWIPLVTDGMLQDKEERVTYNSPMHIGLFRIDMPNNERKYSLAKLISESTEVQLLALDLVSGVGSALQLTREGKDVLEELAEIDPAKDERYWHIFATALIGYQDDKDRLTPVHTFAREHGYVINKLPSEWTPAERRIWTAGDVRSKIEGWSFSPYGRPTGKGSRWLKRHSEAILRRTSSQRKRENLIPFLPLQCLPKFLVSEDRAVSAIAKRREAELRRKQ